MKKSIYMMISALFLFILNDKAIPNTQEQVKLYLKSYADMLIYIRDFPSTAQAYLLSGNYHELAGPQLSAAIEVLQLIDNGDLDDCCWVGNVPEEYTEYTTIPASALLLGEASATYPKYSGGVGTFYVNPDLTEDYSAMGELLNITRGMYFDYSGSDMNAQRMKRFEHQLSVRLHSLWDNLSWTFVYADDTLLPDPMLKSTFRENYAFACIICFGAGFYDISRLHLKTDTNSYTAITQYDQLINKLSIATQNWMLDQANQQYPAGINWNGKVPIQISAGLAWQSSPAADRGNENSPNRIYPSHCHGATALYKVINPLAIIKDIGDVYLKNKVSDILPYTENAELSVNGYVSHFGSANFTADMYPEWQNRKTNDSFRETGIGSIFYVGERDHNASHNGRWVLLTKWARFTSPAEGTYFPLHTTNISPSAPPGGCNLN